MAGVGRTWIGAVLAAMAAGACAVAAVPAASASPAPGGTIATVAGGVGGPGPARSVAVSACGVQVSGRSLYIGNFLTVRRVSTSTGALTTVAGNNTWIGGGNGDPAAKVGVRSACGTAVDAAGNLLIADGQQIRVVPASTGIFTGSR